MTLKLNGSTSGSVSIDAPASTAGGADVALTLPVNDGDANQFLQTNGSGVLSWASVNVKRTTASQVNLPTDAGLYTWTGIPANAFQIDIFLGRISGNTASAKHPTFRLGHAGSGGTVVTSGYKSVTAYVEDSYQNSDAYTDYFGLMPSNYGEPAQIFSTSATLYRSYGDIWTFRSMTCRDEGSNILPTSFWGNGFIDLGATLDRVQLYLTGGNFDMGVAGLSYLETV